MLDSWHEPVAEAEVRLDRRALLQGTGAAALSAAGTAAVASPGFYPALVERVALESGATVALQHRRFALPDATRGKLSANGVRLLDLEGDLVRMWRGEHADLLSARATRLLGVTPWMEFLLVRGLAAESRRRVRYERHDATTDCIVWLIA
jgi:hypothetical protein